MTTTQAEREQAFPNIHRRHTDLSRYEVHAYCSSSDDMTREPVECQTRINVLVTARDAPESVYLRTRSLGDGPELVWCERGVKPGQTERLVALSRHATPAARLADQMAAALTSAGTYGATRAKQVTRAKHDHTARAAQRAAVREATPGMTANAAWAALNDGATSVQLSKGGRVDRVGDELQLTFTSEPYATRPMAGRATVRAWLAVQQAAFTSERQAAAQQAAALAAQQAGSSDRQTAREANALGVN